MDPSSTEAKCESNTHESHLRVDGDGPEVEGDAECVLGVELELTQHVEQAEKKEICRRSPRRSSMNQVDLD